MKTSQFFSTLASVKNTTLKMVMGVMFFFSLMSFSTAQQNPCCKKLKITGQKFICRIDPPSGSLTYSITTGLPTGCSTTPHYTWTVTTNTGGSIACSQGGTSTNFNVAAIPAGATSLTITVGTFCNGQCYSGTFTVKVSPILNASYNVTLSTSGSGMSLSATATSTVGLHYWRLYRVDCTTQTYIATSGFPVNGSASTFTYASLPAGNCYVLYHWNYVNGCFTYKRRFFTITQNKKLATQVVEDDVPIPAQLRSSIPFLNKQRRD
ncbi:MAG: hypothetical protein U5L45_05825 [Saprospiraceae bacterium]|nr:hypothetical protein [Saprospiraceae bacterium]